METKRKQGVSLDVQAAGGGWNEGEGIVSLFCAGENLSEPVW